MALRKIALQGEECLTKVCRPVTEFNDRLHTLLDDMAETLEEAGGVGLAAPQVGILRRVCIVLNEDDEIIELINPEIVYTEGEETALEGCLSVPGKYGPAPMWCVSRRRTVTASGLRWRTRGSLPAASAMRSSIWTATCLWNILTA